LEAKSLHDVGAGPPRGGGYVREARKLGDIWGKMA